MRKQLAICSAWFILLCSLPVMHGHAQNWLVYDITPAAGSKVVLDPMSGMIGIQVRVRFGTTPPDSILIKSVETQYPDFPAVCEVRRTGSSPIEDSGMGGKIKAWWFVLDIGGNGTEHTSGTISGFFAAYNNGRESLQQFGFSCQVEQLSMRLDPGTITGEQTIYCGETAGMLQGTKARSYNEQYIDYEWYKDAGDGWQIIPGAEQTFLRPGKLLTTTRFKRMAMDEWARGASNILTITVRDPQTVRADPAKNYILRSVPRQGDASPIADDAADNLSTITYYDDLGRPEQIIEVNGSPDGKDMVQAIAYDAFGRDDAVSYLPYPAPSTYGSYKAEWQRELDEFYGQCFYGSKHHSAFPQTDTRYEVSALGRILSQRGPGSEFRELQKERLYSYDTNGPEELLWFERDGNRIVCNGSYPPNRLYKTRIEDEDNGITEKFTDYVGSVVLERRYLSDSLTADTYYIYDALRRPVCVLPPLAVEKVDTAAGKPIPEDILAEYAYRFTVDGRGNITSSTVPGGVTEATYYTGFDKPETSTHRYGSGTENKIYTYDGLGRVLLEVHAVAKPNDSPDGPAAIDMRDTMAAYAYDRYPNMEWAAFTPVAGVVTEYDPRVKGFKTWEKIRILDFSRDEAWTTDRIDPPCIERVFYYDQRGRLIQTVEQSSRGDLIRYTTGYDWLGNAIVVDETHYAAFGSEPLASIRTENRYDDRNRLTESVIRVDGRNYATTVNRYDELGLLAGTSRINGEHALSDTMQYNIRGWITRIASPLFETELSFTVPTHATPSYTGRISETRWRHNDGRQHLYAFAYDALSRLTDATHYIDGQPSEAYTERDIAYDVAGNLLQLSRYGEAAKSYTYHYTYSGNRLAGLQEQKPGPESASHDYKHDVFGNRIEDGRNLLRLQYNFLNLVQRVTDTLGRTQATYLYDWQGGKRSVRDASGLDGLDYAGSLIYAVSDGVRRIESIAFPGGRLVATSDGYEPHYYLTDHLGSVRAVVDGDGEVLERNDYYPFGARWMQADCPVSANRYRFNGKEEQSFVNLPFLDYGARMYEPDLGRWFNVDPDADKYYPVSPYAYCANDPIRFIDPDGKKIVDTNGTILWHNNRWTDAAENTDAMRVGNAMMKTNVGRNTWKAMAEAGYDISISVHPGLGPQKELGRADITKNNGITTNVGIHIYEASIEKQVEPQYKSERAKRLRPLSSEDRLGTIGVHEGIHAIDKTLPTVNRSIDSPREKIAVAAENRHVKELELKAPIVKSLQNIFKD